MPPRAVRLLDKSPHLLMPLQYKFLTFLEAKLALTINDKQKKGLRLFSLLPTKNGFTCSHLKICANALSGLLRRAGVQFLPPDGADFRMAAPDIWRYFFHVDKYETDNRKFAGEILTDGKAVSIVMRKPKMVVADAKAPKLEDLDERWGLDPGRRDLFCATNERGSTIRWSTRRFYEEAKYKYTANKVKLWQAQDSMVLEAVRNMPSKKTADLEAWKKYVQFMLPRLDMLVTWSMRRKLRDLKFTRYVMAHRKLDKICYELTARAGSRTVVGFGDWSNRDQAGIIKRAPAGPVKRLEHRLKRTSNARNMRNATAADVYAIADKLRLSQGLRLMKQRRDPSIFKNTKSCPLHKLKSLPTSGSELPFKSLTQGIRRYGAQSINCYDEAMAGAFSLRRRQKTTPGDIASILIPEFRKPISLTDCADIKARVVYDQRVAHSRLCHNISKTLVTSTLHSTMSDDGHDSTFESDSEEKEGNGTEGYLYAVAAGNHYSATKFGRTKSKDPVTSLIKRYQTSLVPLNIISVVPVVDYIVAEALMKVVFARRRLEARHEVFNMLAVSGDFDFEAWQEFVQILRHVNTLNGGRLPEPVEFVKLRREATRAARKREGKIRRKAAKARRQAELQAANEEKKRKRQEEAAAVEMQAKQARNDLKVQRHAELRPMLQEFIEKHCVLGVSFKLPTTVLQTKFTEYVESNVTNASIKRLMSDLGYSYMNSNGSRKYSGLKLQLEH
eukprot:jgi/Astpho2/5820/fgenesh1_pg.00080_%23_69_t